jgi:hypothetical protein
LLRRTALLLGLVVLAVFAVSSAGAVDKRAVPCGTSAYSYAGLQSDNKANGVSATLAVTQQPNVSDGHVGGWIGLGGTGAGPGGAAEWIQTGFAATTGDQTSHMYYEVTVAGSQPKYVEIAPSIAAGAAHHFSVLEMSHHKSWWRVWVDNRPVSPPIHLPGSHGVWYPQAVAENWNGGAGACNTYGYRFSNVSLATAADGVWRPLKRTYTFQDPGYRVVPISSAPRAFLATSL